MSDNELNLLSHKEFEKSIKLMQKYAHIPQTGQIDGRTIAVMKLPRCGVPDVENDRFEESSSLKRHRRRSITKRFAVYGPKWDKSPITWKYVVV